MYNVSEHISTFMNNYDESDKKPTGNGPQKTTDKDILDALELIQRSYNSQYRSKALAGIREDRLIDEALNDTLPSSLAFSQIKDTSMFQLKRIVREDNYSLPAVMAQPAIETNEIVKYAAEDLVKRANVMGNMNQQVRHMINDACFRDGSSIMEIIPEDYKDYRKNKNLQRILLRKYDPANVFYDPRCKNYVYDGDWIAFRHEYSNATAEKVAKGLYGYEKFIKPGDPLSVFNKEESNENDVDILPETTVFYVFWNKVKKIRCVIAGGCGQEIQKKKGQKEYPYKNNYGECDFPVLQYDASVDKYGVHALSYIGVGKDITRQKRKQFNTILPYFERVNNQVLAVMGASSADDLANQMNDAMEMQAQGMQGLLSINDPQARVTPVYPQDVTSAFERIGIIFDNELAKRLGFDLGVQEKQVSGGQPTATQIIERAKVHAKAIANLNKINVDFHTRLSDIVLNYSRILYSDSDEPANLSAGDEDLSVTLGDYVTIVEDFRGGWTVDTSVELQLTRNEKITIMGEFTNEIAGLLQLPAMSVEEVKLIQDLLWARIKLLGLDEYIQKAEINAFFQAIIKRNSAQMQAEQAAAQGQGQGGGQPQGGGAQGDALAMQDVQDQAAAMGADAPQPEQSPVRGANAANILSGIIGE